MTVGRPLPSELRGRLRPIVMLLSSSHDGETLAAARSIARLLQKHGRDWHDLADHVAADGAVAPLPQSHAPQPGLGRRYRRTADRCRAAPRHHRGDPEVGGLAVGQLPRISQQPRVQGPRLSDRGLEREAASMAGRPRPQAAAERPEPMRLEVGTPFEILQQEPRWVSWREETPKGAKTRPRFVTRPDPPGTPAPQIRAPGEATLKPSACWAAMVPASS